MTLGFLLLLGAIVWPAGIPNSMEEQLRTKLALAPRIVKINGIDTLEVNGRPFLVVGAQCDVWRSTRQDAKTIEFFEGYRDMNATTVSIGIPWSKIEPAEDHYDFHFIDWFIRQAEANGLKLILNLFNTNVCGKVGEGSGPDAYPGYTPSYILAHPEKYKRMVLPYPYKYVDAGPPMCPNDPNTLDRERRLVVKVAQHLRDTDAHRTVLMLQLDNEFYYQQWDGKRPVEGSEEELAIRCQCPHCLAKWQGSSYANGEEFMFKSFADYVRVLSDAITETYPIPIYVNSPWWPPRVIPIFLSRCPNLALVGVDGILSPQEPNWLSRSMLDRNIPFAAENPTENSEVRLNLDVLPYYTIVGRQGIGNLLWECHEPFTVVNDPVAKARYKDALYPLKHAQSPIARTRGTDRLVGWYALRDIRPNLTTDVFGNYIPAKPNETPLQRDRWFVREGTSTRIEEGGRFTVRLGRILLQVSGSSAGIVVRNHPSELVFALPSGQVSVSGIRGAQAELGYFDGDVWKIEGPASLRRRDDGVVICANRPCVIRLSFRESK